MRGCRGGVSPCSGMSRQPGRSTKNKSKGKKARVPEQATKSARVGNGRFAQPQGKKPEFPSRRRGPPALGTAGKTYPMEPRQRKRHAPQPPGHDLIRPRCTRPPSPKGKAFPRRLVVPAKHRNALPTESRPRRRMPGAALLHARCQRCDLIRPRCARPPSPQGKAFTRPHPRSAKKRPAGRLGMFIRPPPGSCP